jgi:hypothetical protein
MAAATGCLAASPGYFVAEPAAIVQTPCAEGFEAQDPGALACTPIVAALDATPEDGGAPTAFLWIVALGFGIVMIGVGVNRQHSQRTWNEGPWRR